MGGIIFGEANPDERMLIGDYRGVRLVVVGTTGQPEAWRAAVTLADTFQLSPGWALLVDVDRAMVKAMQTIEITETAE